MADNEGTGTTEQQAPEVGAGAPRPGTDVPDELVTLLKSRNAGLDAKVTELTKAQKLSEQKAADALQKLADYEAKTVGSDEALRAQLAARDAEVAQARRETALARAEAKYPETFALFGEDAATFSEDKLAASEARLSGATDSGEPPTPRGVNGPGQRDTSTPAKPQTIADVEKQLAAIPIPW